MEEVTRFRGIGLGGERRYGLSESRLMSGWGEGVTKWVAGFRERHGLGGGGGSREKSQTKSTF